MSAFSDGTVLVPHDLTDFSDAGLEAVQRLGVDLARVQVVHVLPRLDLAHPSVIWPTEEDEPRREHALRALRARLAGTVFADVPLHVQLGDPGTRVVELAKALGASLIVLPSHGRTGLERLVLGSVAEHVARFAPCPVLVLPAGASRAPAADPPPPRPPPRREDQVETVAVDILTAVGDNPGFLTAARIAIPEDHGAEWWEEALEKRLLDSGIEFVDLAFAPSAIPEARILALRFEDGFV